MSRRLTGIAITCASLLAFGYASTAEAQLLGSSPLPIPITGSVVGGGNFSGTLNIQRFAVQGSATVAIAAITGAIVNAPGMDAQTGMRANVTLPVTVSAAVPISYRSGPAARYMLVRQCGSDVHVQIGAGAMVNVMGSQVVLNPAVLDVGANTGGLIGSLVCQVLSLLNNPTMLVSVLNSLLVQLVPLIGGLGGGLLL